MAGPASPIAGQSYLFEDLAPPQPRSGIADFSQEAIGCPSDSSWRRAVAGCPHARWVAWLRRSEELTPAGANAPTILAAQWRAYRELSIAASRPAADPA